MPILLLGFRKAEAATFATALNAAWRQAILDLTEAHASRTDALCIVLDRQVDPRRYPAACLVDPFVVKACALAVPPPGGLPEAALPKAFDVQRASIAAFTDNPFARRNAAITRFTACELPTCAPVLEANETDPFTPEQRLAAVTNDDAAPVLTGLGSGKTSVIAAKARTSSTVAFGHPGEILLLAVASEAASEMAARIETRSGAPIAARTFQALESGLIPRMVCEYGFLCNAVLHEYPASAHS